MHWSDDCNNLRCYDAATSQAILRAAGGGYQQLQTPPVLTSSEHSMSSRFLDGLSDTDKEDVELGDNEGEAGIVIDRDNESEDLDEGERYAEDVFVWMHRI